MTACTVSLLGHIHQNFTAAWLTHISVQFRHLALFWHQPAAASLMHLRTSQCYPTLQRKLIWVSQSAAECFIRHAVVWVHSGLSPLFSLALSLRPVRRTLCLFFALLSLLITFGESCRGDSNTYCTLAGLQSCFTVRKGCRPHSGCACMPGFQEPYANTEWEGRIWWSSTLFMSEWDYAQSQCSHFLETCLCVCVCVCVHTERVKSMK